MLKYAVIAFASALFSLALTPMVRRLAIWTRALDIMDGWGNKRGYMVDGLNG